MYMHSYRNMLFNALFHHAGCNHAHKTNSVVHGSVVCYVSWCTVDKSVLYVAIVLTRNSPAYHIINPLTPTQ